MRAYCAIITWTIWHATTVCIVSRDLQIDCKGILATERLQKLMARAGLGSRRACEAIIAQGRVLVNGKTAKIGDQADPTLDDVRVDNVRLRDPQELVYVALNKPRGVISDEDVAGNWPRARDMIPVAGHLYPVGRLDLQSEGLMLFTNDGELAHRLTHPRYERPKTYLVTIDGVPSHKTLEAWRRGVMLEGRLTAPADVIRIGNNKEGVILRVTVREGRKRLLRRVAAQLGHSVRRLQRVRLATLDLGDLPVGSWRRLTKAEINDLHRDVAAHHPGEQVSETSSRPARSSAGRQSQSAAKANDRRRSGHK
jgi:23S rRNA pseudouridine2605 synthase